MAWHQIHILPLRRQGFDNCYSKETKRNKSNCNHTSNQIFIFFDFQNLNEYRLNLNEHALVDEQFKVDKHPSLKLNVCALRNDVV